LKIKKIKFDKKIGSQKKRQAKKRQKNFKVYKIKKIKLTKNWLAKQNQKKTN